MEEKDLLNRFPEYINLGDGEDLTQQKEILYRNSEKETLYIFQLEKENID